MSAHTSSDAVTPRRDLEPAEAARFLRWPGLLRLTLGVTVGPVAVLVNEELIYVTNMWACGTGAQLAMHIVPLVCLLVTLGVGFISWGDWVSVGRGVEDEAATVPSRSRFLAIGGLAISAISALLILAQWLAIFVFGACMRA
jgi:hypothetical protein